MTESIVFNTADVEALVAAKTPLIMPGQPRPDFIKMVDFPGVAEDILVLPQDVREDDDDLLVRFAFQVWHVPDNLGRGYELKELIRAQDNERFVYGVMRNVELEHFDAGIARALRSSLPLVSRRLSHQTSKIAALAEAVLTEVEQRRFENIKRMFGLSFSFDVRLKNWKEMITSVIKTAAYLSDARVRELASQSWIEPALVEVDPVKKTIVLTVLVSGPLDEPTDSDVKREPRYFLERLLRQRVILHNPDFVHKTRLLLEKELVKRRLLHQFHVLLTVSEIHNKLLHGNFQNARWVGGGEFTVEVPSKIFMRDRSAHVAVIAAALTMTERDVTEAADATELRVMGTEMTNDRFVVRFEGRLTDERFWPLVDDDFVIALMKRYLRFQNTWYYPLEHAVERSLISRRLLDIRDTVVGFVISTFDRAAWTRGRSEMRQLKSDSRTGKFLFDVVVDWRSLTGLVRDWKRSRGE